MAVVTFETILIYKAWWDVSLISEILVVGWGKGCMKIVSVKLDTKTTNCEKPGVEQTQLEWSWSDVPLQASFSCLDWGRQSRSLIKSWQWKIAWISAIVSTLRSLNALGLFLSLLQRLTLSPTNLADFDSLFFVVRTYYCHHSSLSMVSDVADIIYK